MSDPDASPDLAQTPDLAPAPDLAREVERLRAALRASEAREHFLRAILDRTEDSVTVKDVEGRYVYVNPITTDLVGLPLEACVGHLDREFFPPEAYERIRAADLATMETGRAMTYEITIDSPFWGLRTHHTHKFPFLDRDGRVAGVAAIIRDVTERKRIELELRESEARFSGLVAATFDGYCLHEKGVLIEVNQALADMYGYAVEEMIGMNGIETAAPEYRAAIMERVRAGDETPYEVEALRKDGTRFALEIVGKQVMYQGREVRISAFRDITRRKQLEKEREAQNERLKELDYLKSCFVGAVSHELRTPLTTIRGYAEFLEEDVGGTLEGSHRDYVRQILEGTARMERLVDDLLDFAKLESGDFKLVPHACDLAAMVTTTVQALGPAARERGLALTATAPAALPLRGDAGRIEQVLTNLVGNALKFTPPGGQVRVTATADGAHARVEVRDTGCGIAPEHLPHLFERFYQASPGTTRQAGGIGLGLSICRALVEAHGGAIGVASEPGAGAAFWFTLPVAAPADEG